MTGPLAGRSVVVTRARGQASALVERLTGLGAAVVELPVIAIADPDDGGRALAEAADRAVAGSYRWIVVTSANAVPRLLAALAGREVAPWTRWAAVGAATARALDGGGVPVDLVPPEAVSEALVEAFPDATTPGPDAPAPGPDGTAPGPDATAPGGAGGAGAVPRVLFARAEEVRDVVAPGLAAKGWAVDEVVAYRTVAGAPDAAAVAAARRADAIALTSSSTVRRSIELLGADGLPPTVVSIGPVTSEALRAVGLAPAAEADPHDLDGLVAAVVAALS